MKATRINLPCLKGKMGDWMYYVTLLKFKDIAERVFLPEEIDEKYKGSWRIRELMMLLVI